MHAVSPSSAIHGRHRAARQRQRVSRHMCFAATAKASAPIVVLPGLGNASEDYDELCRDLRAATGSVVVTARVSRPDWLRNAAGIVDVNYWRGTLNPRPTVDWYLDAITAAVQEARSASGQQRVAFVAHSAGGWLSRVWMQAHGGLDGIEAIVTLGSPLRPPPTDVPGVIDQTRGILSYVDANCPSPADVAKAGGRFVCIAGKYIHGTEVLSPENLNAWVVGQGYRQVCGDGAVWGDGITPTQWALLPGAEHVELDGVFHTPVGAGPGPWYGSPGVLDLWVHHLGGTATTPSQPASSAAS